jgi:hypothetical protein
VLPLVGREVDQLCIDYAVTLVVDGTDTIRLESPFTLHVDGTTQVVDPERLETVAAVLQLFRAVVTRAEAGKDGSLTIDFDSDRWLRAEAIEDGRPGDRRRPSAGHPELLHRGPVRRRRPPVLSRTPYDRLS